MRGMRLNSSNLVLAVHSNFYKQRDDCLLSVQRFLFAHLIFLLKGLFMKNVFKIAALSSALALGASIAQASDKLAFVDAGFLMQNHPLAIEAEEKFTKFMKENQAKFEDENKALVEEEQKLVTENQRLTDKNKALETEFKKFAEEGQKFEKDSKALEAAAKAKMAELDKNTRLSTKQKQAELDKVIGKRSKELQARGASLQKRQNELNAKAKPFEAEGAAFQKKVEAFEKKRKAFEEKVAAANKEAGGFEPQEVQKKIVENINETIKKVAQDKGYTIVFPMTSAPLYVVDEKVDITEEVLVSMGGKLPEPVKADEANANEKAAKPEEAK